MACALNMLLDVSVCLNEIHSNINIQINKSGMDANETTIHQSSNEVDIINQR